MVAPPDPRCRSVNDYQTTTHLRCALTGGLLDGGGSCHGEASPSSSLAFPESPNEHQEPLDWMLYNYDKENSIPQRVDYELKRLQVLKSYHVLDDFGQEEPSFTRITNLAARMFDMPIAIVSLMDMGRQYFVSVKGLGETKEMPRSISFCTHAILSCDDVFVVKDATKDVRFQKNPLVTGPPHIRFYAGAPLLSPEGFKLGSLCVIDRKPRSADLTLVEKQNLRELAAVVVENMVDRRTARRVAMGQGMATTAHDLLAPVTSMSQNLLRALADKDNNRELLVTFLRCSELMSRICHGAILEEATQRSSSALPDKSSPATNHENKTTTAKLRDPDMASSSPTAKIRRLVEDLEGVISPFPKRVPVQMDIDPSLEDEEWWVGDDLKVARSAINLLVNACNRADRGQVTLRVFGRAHPNQSSGNSDDEDRTDGLLVWEVQDNGPAVPVESYPTLFQPNVFSNCNKTTLPDYTKTDKAAMLSELGLLSVASNIDSLNGDYGFYAREEDGSLPGNVFWFAIPMRRSGASYPDDYDKKDDVDPFVFQKGQVEPEEYEEEEEEVVFSCSSEQEEEPDHAFSHDDDFVDHKTHQPARFRGLGHYEDSSLSSSKLVTWESNDAIQHAQPPISLPMGGGGADYDPYAVDQHLDNHHLDEKIPNGSTGSTEPHYLGSTGAGNSDESISRSITRQRSRKYSVDQAELRHGEPPQEDKDLERAEQEDVLPQMPMPTPNHNVMTATTASRRRSSVMSGRRHSTSSSLISSAASSSSSLLVDNEISMPTMQDLKVQMETVRAMRAPRRNGGMGMDRRRSLDMPPRSSHPALTMHSSDRRDSLTRVLDRDGGDLSSRRSSVGSVDVLSPMMSTPQAPEPPQRCALVVDDSITVRKSLDRALTRLGYNVVQASNGMQGVQELRSRCFDIVFVDFLMPVVDGMDCVQQFRAWEKEQDHRRGFRQYIIGISSHDSDDAIVQQGLQAGMDKFVSKPVKATFLQEFHASQEMATISADLDAYSRRKANERESENGVLLPDEFDSPPPPPPPSRVSTGTDFSSFSPMPPIVASPMQEDTMPSAVPAGRVTATERTTTRSPPPPPPPPLAVSLEIRNTSNSIHSDNNDRTYRKSTEHVTTLNPNSPSSSSPSPLAPALDPNDLAKLKTAAISAVQPRNTPLKAVSPLPEKQALQPQMPQQRSSPPSHQAASSGAPCCLIGVRSRPAAVALYRCVEARGWRASTVDNGEKALRLLKMRQWDLVFLDENLPGMSGAASVAHFRDWEAAQAAGPPKQSQNIYLLSDRLQSGGSSAMEPLGPNGVLGKPIQTRELTQILDVAGAGKGGAKMGGFVHRRADNVRGMMKRIMLPRK